MSSTLFRQVITGFVCSRRDGDAMAGPGRAASCRAEPRRAQPSSAPARPVGGGRGPPRAKASRAGLKAAEGSRKRPGEP